MADHFGICSTQVHVFEALQGISPANTSAAPLLDANGEVAFFLGGQVNCSSSIQGKPDIMKILATSPDHKIHDYSSTSNNQKIHTSPAAELARRVESVKSLRYRHKAQIAAEPGVERGLFQANQDIPLPDRLERFYNAYSKVQLHHEKGFLIAADEEAVPHHLLPKPNHPLQFRRHLRYPRPCNTPQL